jgi:hypothetical protein
LPDCYIPPTEPGPNPSKLAWPSILANCLGRECINISSPGASNKKIWNDIIHFDYQQTDIVFVLWSYIARTSIIHSSKKITFMGPWTEHTNYYKEFYDKHDATLMSSLFVNHANMFLDSKKITVHNIIIGKRELPVLNLNKVITNHIPVYINDIRENYPTALDNIHPGLECQTTYSKQILDFLNIKNELPVVKKLSILDKIKRHMKQR